MVLSLVGTWLVSDKSVSESADDSDMFSELVDCFRDRRDVLEEFDFAFLDFVDDCLDLVFGSFRRIFSSVGGLIVAEVISGNSTIDRDGVSRSLASIFSGS